MLFPNNMSVFEIPKFEISSEDAESFDFPSYIADKYEDHEYCGGFLIKPPADFIKPYNFETLSQAMPVVEWKQQRRQKLVPNIYTYEADKLPSTTPEDLVKVWNADIEQNQYFNGHSPSELMQDFWKLMEDSSFTGARYADSMVGDLFPGKFPSKSQKFCYKNNPKKLSESDNNFNLKNLKPKVEEDLPVFDGFTTDFLFTGTRASWFSLHIEESDQTSVNFLHKMDRTDEKFKNFPPAHKVWLMIPPGQSHHVEVLLDLLVPEKDKWCKNFLGHRYLLANPHLFTEFNIDYYLAKQEEAEFMIVLARTYHTGMSIISYNTNPILTCDFTLQA